MRRGAKKYEAELSCEIRDLIDSDPARRESLENRIRQDIEFLRQAAELIEQTPTPGQARKQLKTYARALRKARALANGLFPPLVAPAHNGAEFERLVEQLDRAAESVEAFAASLNVSRGAQRWDAIRYTAKLFATNTLRDFGRNPYGRGGPAAAEQVAQLLHEIVTGIEAANLADYVIRKDRALDRIEPALSAKAKFAG